MGNRFFYNMPPTVAIERLNQFDDEVQVAAGAAVEAAAAASVATVKAGEAAGSAAAASGAAGAAAASVATATGKAAEASGSATAAGGKAAEAAASATAAASKAAEAVASASAAATRADEAANSAAAAHGSADEAAGSAAAADAKAGDAIASAAAAELSASAAADSAADAQANALAIQGNIGNAGQLLAAAQQAAADINANIAGAASNAAAADASADAATASAAAAAGDAAAAQASAAAAADAASFASAEADRAQAAADTATEGQVQADWAENDSLEKSFIRNKPVQLGTFELPANTGTGWARLGRFTARRSGELLFIRMLGAPVIGSGLWDTELTLRTRNVAPPAFPGSAVYTYANRNTGPGPFNPASIKIKAVGSDPEATEYEVWIAYGIGGNTVPGFYEVSLTPSASWLPDPAANQPDPGDASEFVLPVGVVTPTWYGVMTTASFGNVQNTLDLDKPVSTATQAALNLKANLDSPAFTGAVTGITATMVGLPNVENKSSATIRAELTAANVQAPLAGVLKLERSAFPQLILKDSDAAADQGQWGAWVNDGGDTFALGPQTDTGSGTQRLQLFRSGALKLWGAALEVDNGSAASDSAVRISGKAGQARYTQLSSGNLARWRLIANSAAEAGSNAGSDFAIERFNDAGAYLGTPVFIERASGNVNLAQNLVVAGNLTVNGTTVTANASTVTVDDPVITLGGDTAPVAADGKDRGVEMRYYAGGSARLAFMGYDASADRFALLLNANNTGEVFSGTRGTLDANLAGDVSGNLTGNVTGNVSGTAANVTGTVALANGGTGATSAAAAATNLGLGTGNVPVFSGAVLASAYPNLRFQETDAASGSRFARVDFTGGVMKVQRLGDDGVTWTSDMLSLSVAGVLGIGTVNATTLNAAEQRLVSASPVLYFDETGQAGGTGLFRLVADNGVLRLDRNTAAGRDFSSYATMWQTGANNNFLDQPLIRARQYDCSLVASVKGSSGNAAQTFNYEEGSVQSLTVTGAHSWSFSNWPGGGDLGVMLVETTNGGAFGISFTTTVYWQLPAGGYTASFANYMTAIGRTALQASGVDQLLFWSRDGGTTVYGKIV